MTITRWEKLNRHLGEQGLGALPGWAAEWAYWNGRLYRIPVATRLRMELKYRQPHKKYGITDPIIVYQMGKVGSSSVYDALRDLDLDVPVYHAHVLNRFDVYEAGVRETRAAPGNDLDVLSEGRAMRRIVDSGRWRAWSLISLVRAPIPRAVSDFFENVFAYIPDFFGRFERGEITLAEVSETFWTRYQDFSPIHWFDDQVRDVFGIDVYAAPFPHARGFAIYQNERARLLLMRLEDLNRCAPRALDDYFGLRDLPLTVKNSASTKAHGDLYRQFGDQLRLPDAYIQKMHSTAYARHFYTPEELEASVARWRE